ncbi:Dehydrogenase/reductase SDR family member on chromosome X [Acropora cervicornis]|uniref:Dehydrogenase/reductase SDR family member on chromosome X n=1 Tax=Acropora cervicornis TaxID=6130 RepID=A0AAD9QL77_ACRCE|nr:Dehydrogenase/reductase SDR family member on chromosome X [Acropora cervicornis]
MKSSGHQKVLFLSPTEFPNLDGRVAIITGGNRGIGLETVKGLCKANVTVIIACRDENSAEKAIKEVKEEFPAAKVDFMKLDLGSLKSIQTFAKNFKEKGLPLHILINNAGIMCPPYGTTEDGFELTFGINHLGHFALTNLLLDELIKKYYSALEAYNQSKLANVLFSYELNRRLKEKNCPVTSNAVHPGIVNTELFHGLPWCLKIPQDGLIYLLFKTPKQGADSSLYVALSPEIEGLGGLYFVNSSPSQSSEESHREDLQKKLWKISCGSLEFQNDSNRTVNLLA